MTNTNLIQEKCRCGSVQFKYSGDCLSCGLTKRERELISDAIDLGKRTALDAVEKEVEEQVFDHDVVGGHQGLEGWNNGINKVLSIINTIKG